VPHDPRVAPREFMEMYHPADIPLPASFLPMHPFDNGEMTVRDEQLAPWPRTPEVIRRHLADYYACITCLDYHLGRVFDCLKTLGQLDNTVIIFAGDNGLSLGEHGLMGKQNLYEFGGMHVPLIIAGPGIAHRQSEAFVYLYDLFPTLCDLAGVPVPASSEGRSLVPVLSGKATQLRDSLFTAYKDVQRAVRTDRWKPFVIPKWTKPNSSTCKPIPASCITSPASGAKPPKWRKCSPCLSRRKSYMAIPVFFQVPSPNQPSGPRPKNSSRACSLQRSTITDETLTKLGRLSRAF